MPPYQPLAAPQMKLPDWFMNPQFTELNDAISANEKLRAQELVNQANDLSIQKASRQNESDIAIRDILKKYAAENQPTAAIPAVAPEQIGQNMDGSPMMSEGTPGSPASGGFDSRRISELVANAAAGAGDYNTAIAAARNSRLSAGDQELTPEQVSTLNMQGVPVALGDTMRIAQAYMTAGKAKTYNESMTDPDFLKNRELNVELKEQRLKGEQIRPMTPAQTQQAAAAAAFQGNLQDVRDEYLDNLPESMAGRWFDKTFNPNSETARLQKELGYIAKSFALSLENRITDKDEETARQLTTLNNLDTAETIKDKLNRLELYAQRRMREEFGAMRKGGFNVSGFTKEDPGLIQGSGSIPTAESSQAAEKQAYKEQYKAKLRAQRGL